MASAEYRKSSCSCKNGRRDGEIVAWPLFGLFTNSLEASRLSRLEGRGDCSSGVDGVPCLPLCQLSLLLFRIDVRFRRGSQVEFWRFFNLSLRMGDR